MARMEVVMNKIVSSVIVLGLLGTACSNGGAPDPVPGAPAAAAAAAAGPAAANGNAALEQALADVDTGRDPARVRASLEAVVADPATSREDRSRADVALARLLGATDKDRAVAVLEDAVSLGDSDAQNQLFTLLAGHAPPSPYRQHDDAPVAPIAQAFAHYFPAATPDRKVSVDIVEFGPTRDSQTQEALGTFAISTVLRKNAVESCGVCDEVKTNISTHRSHERLWSAIPQYAGGKLDQALVVLYVDAETMVPERYASWLAAPLGDVTAALEHGQGLVAVKERPGAPPLVTIAAPREAQLVTVEAALAAMHELPKAPVPVKLASGLSKEEIRDAVQARFGAFRGCYRELLERQPRSSGTAQISYTVKNTGEVTDAKVSLDPGIEEPAHRACFEKVVATLRYPAWSSDPKDKTTVRYPIVLANTP